MSVYVVSLLLTIRKIINVLQIFHINTIGIMMNLIRANQWLISLCIFLSVYLFVYVYLSICIYNVCVCVYVRILSFFFYFSFFLTNKKYIILQANDKEFCCCFFYHLCLTFTLYTRVRGDLLDRYFFHENHLL